MTHKPGVYVPLRAFFLVSMVWHGRVWHGMIDVWYGMVGV